MAFASFKKGVHPPDFKYFTEGRPIEDLPLAAEISVPLSQHIGAPAKALKSRGDEVAVGELLAEAAHKISAHVHSPVAGKVKRVASKPLPGGRLAEHIDIEVDEETTRAHRFARVEPDLEAVGPRQIAEKMAWAGLVGMGGATFPTHVKFSPPPGAKIDTLIVNGVECEPYLTCDHRLMLEQSAELIDSLALLKKAYGFERVVFGIENNKPDAIEAMSRAAAARPEVGVEVVGLHVKYPQGAEKMLIKSVTGRVVPAGDLPLAVGVIVSNVQTLFALYEAFYLEKPVLDRVLTVSGKGIAEPKNLRALIGTPLAGIAEYCGGTVEGMNKLVTGGPMTGMALPSLDYVVVKGTSGYLFFTDVEVPEEGPCIRCGRCVDACPMFLMPLKLRGYIKNEQWMEAKDLGLASCFECGSCAFSCPAKIRLVSWIRYGKNYVRVKGIGA
jgi:electron transport complex protein RnfC